MYHVIWPYPNLIITYSPDFLYYVRPRRFKHKSTPHHLLNTIRPMRHDRPTPESIIRITHLPTIRNRTQQRTLTPRAILRTKHAQIMPIILNRALPRQTLHVRGIIFSLQCLAGQIIPAVAMKDACVDVGVVGVAGWDGVVEESEVPLLDGVTVSGLFSIGLMKGDVHFYTRGSRAGRVVRPPQPFRRR